VHACVPGGEVVGEAYAGGAPGLPEREPEALDVARGVVVGVDQLLRQDEVVRLDVVEDGDDGLARLDERGELAEAVVGVAVVPGEDGHGDAALADGAEDALLQVVPGAHRHVVQERAQAAVQEPVVQQPRHRALRVQTPVVDEHVVPPPPAGHHHGRRVQGVRGDGTGGGRHFF
jgi:hypothetical protein